MTNPSNPNNPLLPAYADEELFTPRPSYLKTIAYLDQTLARAEDANAVQDNVEAALDAFAADVDLALRALTRSVVSKIMALETRERAFEKGINEQIAAFRLEVSAGFTAVRAYADARDVITFQAARDYTDVEINKLRLLMKAATASVITVTTDDMNDGGNYFGGKTWNYTIVNIPGGSTLFVHRWAFHEIVTGDAGGAADQVTVTWPGFMGYRDIGGKSSFDEESGVRSERPMFAIKGPAQVNAEFFINNVKAKATFTIDGFLTPDALQ